MDKINVICQRYKLSKTNNLINLDDILNNVFRKDRTTLLVKELNDGNKIDVFDKIRYISIDTFKYICANHDSVKTNEITYIFNTELIFDILEFNKEMPIHVIQKDNIKYYRFDDICKHIYEKPGSKHINLINHKDKCKLKDLMNTKICTIFGSDSNTNFITEQGVKHLLLKSRQNSDLRKELADKLDIEIIFENQICLPKETAFLALLTKLLPPDVIIKKQFKVNKYLVDIYFPDYKIVVECDEFGHSKYDKLKDIEREKIIKEKLNCDFIRFNPDDKNYDVTNIIQKILILMFAKMTNISDDINKQSKSEQLESEQLESEQLESEQLESEQLESEQLESEQLESEQLESEQPESEQPESEHSYNNKSKTIKSKGKQSNSNQSKSKQLEEEITLSDDEIKIEKPKNKINIIKEKKEKNNIGNKMEYIKTKEDPKNKSLKNNNCIDCNIEIYNDSTRCNKCRNLKKIKDSSKANNRPSLEQLKKEVNENGYSATGRKYGVSDNAVRKWIKNYEKLSLSKK